MYYVPFSAGRIHRKAQSSPAPRQSGGSGWKWSIGSWTCVVVLRIDLAPQRQRNDPFEVPSCLLWFYEVTPFQSSLATPPMSSSKFPIPSRSPLIYRYPIASGASFRPRWSNFIYFTASETLLRKSSSGSLPTNPSASSSRNTSL